MSDQRPVAVTPHLFVQNTEAAVSFYVKAFGAVELFRNALPDGTVMFVELAVGQGRVLIGEETPSLNALAPPTIGGSPVMLLVEVNDVDEFARRAVEAGATVDMPVEEMFWGERYGVLVDPFGHRWAVSTVREQLTSWPSCSHELEINEPAGLRFIVLIRESRDRSGGPPILRSMAKANRKPNEGPLGFEATL
jgi:uncharacterized glyoxalase superfamily protein PhnB